MSQIKMNKHEVYDYIADHLSWFGQTDKLRYLSCYSIGNHINKLLEKDSPDNPPFIKLTGSTLTAMVYDSVLERVYEKNSRCFAYRPILPINEEYRDP